MRFIIIFKTFLFKFGHSLINFKVKILNKLIQFD